MPARPSDKTTVDHGAYPLLELGLIDTLRRYGVEKPAVAGGTLVAAGAAGFDFFVILEGGVDVGNRTARHDDTIVASLGPGQFVDSLALLTGEPVQLSATVTDNGFLLTGAAVPPTRRDEHDGQTPLALETSRPGVFCVGDARAGSVERLAVAVGEGAVAVRMIPRAPRVPPVNRRHPATTNNERRTTTCLSSRSPEPSTKPSNAPISLGGTASSRRTS